MARGKWLLFGSMVIVGVGAWLLRPARQPLPVSGSNGYASPQTCAPCHAAIWDTYSKTGMGRSFARAGTEVLIEDYEKQNTYYHKASGRHYRIYRQNGQIVQRRHQIGFDGREANVVEKQVHYVLGSGNHSRSYLHRRADGRLVELPVGWYSANHGYWAMNPGYDRPDHEDFRREINFQCMFCHNGYPALEPGADASGTAPVFPADLPQGIDCQRCHGPGLAHVKAMEAGKPSKGTILNPASLGKENQLELCLQCHLETTSFRLPAAIVRYNRPMFSYRPGEPLSDYVLHFDHPPGAGRDDKFEIAHAGYRMRKSACFLKSGGAMVCTTCHNPHETSRGEKAAERYRSACRGCHAGTVNKLIAAGRHTESQDCHGCHMPKRRTEDVVHVVMTDHRIQRPKPGRDLLAPLLEKGETDATAYKGEVAAYYPAQVGELYWAVAQVRQGANLKAGIPRLEAAIRQSQPGEAEFSFELAEALVRNGTPELAIPVYEEALRKKPGFQPAMRGLASALARSGRLAQAAEVLRKAPADAATLNDLGLAQIALGNSREAIATLRRALELNPDDPDAHNSLAGALLASGDRAGAEASYREAIRLQPDFAEAHRNLANLLAATNFAEAQYHYGEAIAARRGYATAHYDYGLALARREQFQKAKEQFEAAVAADPKLAEAHNALGEMFTLQGDAPRALDAYRRAVEARGELAAARSNLGAALLFLGRAAEARPHLEAAVRLDPGSFEAHLNLGKALALARDAGAAEHFRKAAESPDPEIRRAALEALR